MMSLKNNSKKLILSTFILILAACGQPNFTVDESASLSAAPDSLSPISSNPTPSVPTLPPSPSFQPKVIRPDEAWRYGCEAKGMKCIFVCNRYPNETCGNSNPNFCAPEVRPGVFLVFSHAEEAVRKDHTIGRIEVTVPYYKEVMSDPTGNSNKGVTIVRLANQDADCRFRNIYDPDFNEDFRAWFRPSDFREMNFESTMTKIKNYENSRVISAHEYDHYERCEEVPLWKWQSQYHKNWMLVLNPYLNKEGNCSQYQRDPGYKF